MSRLLGCYPSISLHDPETYIAAITTLLCGYSLWVGERAIDRVSKASKFVPSLAELNEACEHFAPSKAARTWADDWDARSRLQLAERARLEAPGAQGERERVAAGFKDLLARLRNDADPKAREFTPERVQEKFDITPEQWAAIPDLPRDFGYWQGIRAPQREAAE